MDKEWSTLIEESFGLRIDDATEQDYLFLDALDRVPKTRDETINRYLDTMIAEEYQAWLNNDPLLLYLPQDPGLNASWLADKNFRVLLGSVIEVYTLAGALLKAYVIRPAILGDDLRSYQDFIDSFTITVVAHEEIEQVEYQANLINPLNDLMETMVEAEEKSTNPVQYWYPSWSSYPLFLKAKTLPGALLVLNYWLLNTVEDDSIARYLIEWNEELSKSYVSYIYADSFLDIRMSSLGWRIMPFSSINIV